MTSREKIDLIARTDPFELVAEIERLRKERDWAWGKGYESAKADRNALIEECAKVADEWQRSVSAKPVGEAIRALKDKP